MSTHVRSSMSQANVVRLFYQYVRVYHATTVACYQHGYTYFLPVIKRKWRTVNGALQPTHCSCSSPRSIDSNQNNLFFPYVSNNWLIFTDTVGFISRSLFPMLLFHEGCQGAQWLSGRVLDSRRKGRGFEPHRRHSVVVLEQDTFILA